MTTQTLNPDGDIAASGITGTGPPWHTQLQWSNDASFATFTSGESSDLHESFGTYTLAGNERCKAARLFTRIGTFNQIWANFYFKDGVDQVLAGFSLWGTSLPATSVTFGWITSAPGGGEWTQAKLNALSVLYDQTNVASELILFDTKVELDIRHRATVDSVTTPTGAQTTRKPTVTWSRTMNDGEVQKKFQVKVFRSDVYGGGGFDPDTSTASYTSAQLASTATSHIVASPGIGDGTFKAYVRVAKDFNGSDWWSTWVPEAGTFTITDPPPLPSNITPADGSTVTTDRPILGGTVNAPTLLARSVIQWQMATDAGFTSNLRSVQEPASDIRLSGPTSEITTAAAELFQTSWYLRARQVDEFGTTSTSWTPTQQFTVSHIPSTSGWVPTGGNTVGFGDEANVLITHDWNFNDASPYDYQTAYQIIVEYNDDATVYSDSAKVSSTNTFAEVSYPDTVKDVVLRWKVRVWDSDDVVGPYSDYNLFIPADTPVVDLLQPVDASTYNNPDPVAIWTFAADGGRTQAEYRVLTGFQGEDPFYDSGWLPGDDNTFDVGDQLYENLNYYFLTVQVRDNTGLEGSDTADFQASWDLPATPTLNLYLEDIKKHGHVTLTWVGDLADGDFVRWELRKRPWYGPSATVSWELLYSSDDPVGPFEVKDWLVGVYRDYQWSLTQVAIRFGVEVSAVWDLQQGYPEADDYWLIHPTDESLNVLLHHVTDDSMKEEYEQEITNILGRGRHQDVGERLGWSGELSAHLRDRDDLTGREQRQQMEAIKATRDDVYLRNPFGDLLRVATGDIDIEREAGIGSGDREYSTAQIEYTEVIDD